MRATAIVQTAFQLLECADQHSAEELMDLLCTALGLSLYALPASPVLCPTNPSHFDLPEN